MAVIVAAVTVMIIGFASYYYYNIASVMFALGMQESFMQMIAILGSAISLFIALYRTPGYLYGAKDFNMLAALPVKPGAILGSKLLSLYISSFVLCFAFTLPGLVVYGIKAGAGPVFYVAGAAATLMLPLIPLVIGAVISYPIMYASTKFRFSNAVTLILYMILIVGIVVGSYSIPMLSNEQFLAGAAIFSNVTRVYPPAQLYTDALAMGSITDWLLFAAASITIPAIVTVIFAKSYRRINSALSERHSKGAYKLKNVSVSGVFSALLSKEANMFISSPIYVMNTVVGMVFFTIYMVVVATMGTNYVYTILGFIGGEDLILTITAAVGMFCVALSETTAPSISLEGSGIWILKTLPLRFWDIAKAKIALNLLVTVPLTIINIIILAIITGASFVQLIGLALALTSFCVLAAVIGLIVNLHFPKLDWKNPAQAVKQSASVAFTVVVNIAIVAICGVAFTLSGFTLTVFSYTAAAGIALLALILLVYLSKNGQRLFNAL